jgi:Ran GTPase-activating protein (RanGAP) involved in mRNA processing and transport
VNPGLARLDLHHCDIDDTGCAVLAYALCSHASSKTCGSTHSTAITVLRLHHNRITSDGAAFLAHALYLNSTLLQLDLEYNQIGPAGALALSDALMINQGFVLSTCRSVSLPDVSCCVDC